MPLRIIIVVHTATGLTAVVFGALATLAPKRPGRRLRSGRTYLSALAVLATTATAIAVARPHTPTC